MTDMWTCRHSVVVALFLLTFLVALPSGAATLNSIRFGTHDSFDRVVCDLSAETSYEIKSLPSGVLELYLRDTQVSDQFFLPKLSDNAKLLTLVEAFRENDRDVVIEIRGKQPLTAKEIVLQGQSWRLALDISGTQTEASPAQKVVPSEQQEKRPYIPGDKPIDTKLADVTAPHKEPQADKVKQEQEKLALAPKQKPENKVPAKENASKQEPKPREPEKVNTTPKEDSEEVLLARLKRPLHLEEPLDTLKALDVLTNFYEVMGDTESAAQFAEIYLEKSGAGAKHIPPVQANQSAPTEPRMPDWILMVLAIVGGVAGGVLGTRLAQNRVNLKWSFKLPKLPKFKKAGKPKEEVEPVAKDLKKQGDALDRAVANEKKPAKKEVPDEVIKEAESAFPADEPAAEVMMKESLMDRRVKRVLELSAQKREIAEIAKELDMGQDEVKLILDLNS